MNKCLPIIFIFILACSEIKEPKKQPKIEEQKQQEHSKYSLEVKEFENGWGYVILSDSKPIIIQKNIPSRQGVDGFSTAEKAKKCGGLILNKLQKGLFPPTVTQTELDSLGVI